MCECLLFVVFDQKTSEPLDPSDFNGYALLSNSITEDGIICNIFSQNGVQIFRNEDECPPALAEAVKDGRVKLLEFLRVDTFSVMNSEDSESEISVNSEDSESEMSVNSEDTDYFADSEFKIPQHNPRHIRIGLRNFTDSEPETSEDSDYSDDSVDFELERPQLNPRIVVGEWNFGAISSLIEREMKIEDEGPISEYFSGFNEVILSVTQHFLALGWCIQITEVHNWSLLHFAVAKDNECLIKLFVKSGVDINVKMTDGATPLHLTILYKHETMMHYLLLQGADINATMHDETFGGASPLHIALYVGAQLEVITCLLEKGANVNADSKLGSILLLAIKSNPQILSCVLQYHPELNSAVNWQAFREALYHNNKEVIDLLHDYGFSSVPDDFDSFFQAISQKNLKTIKQFVEDGVDVNYYCSNHLSEFYGMRPLHIAAENFLEEISQLLLDQGANVRAKSTKGTPVFHAAKVLDLKAVVFLISKGAKIQDDPLILHAAAEFKPPYLGPSEACGYISLNKRGSKFLKKGRTSSVVVPVIETLMENGACFYRADDSMKTLLMGHAYLDNWEVVEILLKHHLFKESEIVEAMIRAIIGDSRKTLEYLLRCRGHPVVKTPFKCSLLEVSIIEEMIKECPDIFPSLLNYNSLNLKLVAESGIFTFFKTDDSDGAYNDSDDSPSQRCVKNHIIKHVTQIKAANLQMNENDSTFSFPTWVRNVDGFQSVCESEIERLKNETIGSSTVPFYDFLNANPAKIYHLLRNECIVDVLKLGDYKKVFPVYSDTIDCLFQKGFYRKSLMKQGVLMFNFLFEESSELPHELKEYILDYLSNQHLLILNNVYKLQQKENSGVSGAQ